MINLSSFKKITALALFYSSASSAAYITEVSTPNDSFINAQFIGSSVFTKKYDENVDAFISPYSYYSATNISTSVAHASILGTGDETVDYFSFQAVQGALYLDIDNGINSGGSFDSWLELYDSSFNLVSSNDDAKVDAGSKNSFYDSGSRRYFSYDSFIDFQVTTDDLYYVLVGGNANPAGIPVGSNYTLNISNDPLSIAPPTSPVPLPASVWLFISGMIGLVGISKRRKS